MDVWQWNQLGPAQGRESTAKEGRMTEDDKRQCKSDTLEELAEMRARRRCLTTKAEKIMGQLESGLAVTRHVLAVEPGEAAPVSDWTPDEKDWPAYADIVAIHEDMLTVCRRIHVLNGRLREWGVID